ncbi:MAG: hypothetical protein AB9891_11370 [Anaerolineaceae bacterium]
MEFIASHLLSLILFSSDCGGDPDLVNSCRKGQHAALVRADRKLFPTDPGGFRLVAV